MTESEGACILCGDDEETTMGEGDEGESSSEGREVDCEVGECEDFLDTDAVEVVVSLLDDPVFLVFFLG